jgi:sulfur-oxidizing protein SoxA
MNSTRLGIIVSSCLLATSLTLAEEIRDFSARPDLPKNQVLSGSEFLTAESRSLQDDEFGNPGLLWVDRGKALYETVQGTASCRDCHQAEAIKAMDQSATRFPRFDDVAGKVINLEQRINVCRTEYQGTEPLVYESEDMLSLTAYLSYQARGKPFEVNHDGAEAEAFAIGRAYYFQRKGQLNLACNQCHDDNWGKMLRGDRISQGHPNAFPAYRNEWQTLGSLHRRLQDCDQGIRAAVLAKGAEEYVGLELYLKWRAANLEIESPGIRR